MPGPGDVRILLAIDRRNTKAMQQIVSTAMSQFVMMVRKEGRIPHAVIFTTFGPTGELRGILDDLREEMPQVLTPAQHAEWDQRYALITEYQMHTGVLVWALTRERTPAQEPG